MTSGGDEVEQSMDTVIPEPRITLDARFFRQDVIVLMFEVAHDLRETRMVS